MPLRITREKSRWGNEKTAGATAKKEQRASGKAPETVHPGKPRFHFKRIFSNRMKGHKNHPGRPGLLFSEKEESPGTTENSQNRFSLARQSCGEQKKPAWLAHKIIRDDVQNMAKFGESKMNAFGNLTFENCVLRFRAVHMRFQHYPTPSKKMDNMLRGKHQICMTCSCFCSI